MIRSRQLLNDPLSNLPRSPHGERVVRVGGGRAAARQTAAAEVGVHGADRQIATAVGEDVEVLMDGGIRRGSDVVMALALGARAVMIGRAYLGGLAANG